MKRTSHVIKVFATLFIGIVIVSFTGCTGNSTGEWTCVTGVMKEPWGNEKAGFTVNGKINRKDWGLNWNTALEAGGVLVSKDVSISCEVQLVRQS